MKINFEKLPPFHLIVSLIMEEWNAVYKNNAPRLLGICRRYVKDTHLAEDLMHNAFITAMNKAHTFSGKGTFEGWLRQIVINTALQHLRKNKTTLFSDNEPVENYSEALLNEADSEETQRQQIEAAGFSQQELLEGIDMLPDHHKIVFNLYVVDGYKHKEIGEMLNISPGTSKSHLARARKKLQQILFEKAKNKDQQKKRGFFWLFFFPKRNYIDKLYADSFSSFEIPPQKTDLPDFGSQSVPSLPKISVLQKLMVNKLMVILASVTVASIALCVILIIKKDEAHSKETLLPNTSEPEVVTSDSLKIDTLSNAPILTAPIEIKAEPESVNGNSIPEKQPLPAKLPKPAIKSKSSSATSAVNVKGKYDSVTVKTPVIIHKKVIQRDTVIQKVPVTK